VEAAYGHADAAASPGAGILASLALQRKLAIEQGGVSPPEWEDNACRRYRRLLRNRRTLQ
jgi:hypothetical protein